MKLPQLMPCPYHDCLPVYFKHELDVWQCWHYWYCPECEKENPTPGKYNSFGNGFSSQYSMSAARANWNNAVHRRQMRLLKNAIKFG